MFEEEFLEDCNRVMEQFIWRHRREIARKVKEIYGELVSGMSKESKLVQYLTTGYIEGLFDALKHCGIRDYEKFFILLASASALWRKMLHGSLYEEIPIEKIADDMCSYIYDHHAEDILSKCYK